MRDVGQPVELERWCDRPAGYSCRNEIVEGGDGEVLHDRKLNGPALENPRDGVLERQRGHVLTVEECQHTVIERGGNFPLLAGAGQHLDHRVVKIDPIHVDADENLDREIYVVAEGVDFWRQCIRIGVRTDHPRIRVLGNDYGLLDDQLHGPLDGI